MTKGQGSNSRSVEMGSSCGMFSVDIWADATRMCRTLEERDLGAKSWDGRTV